MVLGLLLSILEGVQLRKAADTILEIPVSVITAASRKRPTPIRRTWRRSRLHPIAIELRKRICEVRESSEVRAELL